MTESTEPAAQLHDKPMSIQFDGSTPRLALYAFLSDGTCHQVKLSFSDRRVLLETLNRKHSFAIKIGSTPVGIVWGEQEKE